MHFKRHMFGVENVDGSNRLWVAGWHLSGNPSALHIQVQKGSLCGVLLLHCLLFHC